MKHGESVRPGFDDFVEIADGSCARRRRERTVHPDRLSAADEVPAREVAGGEIIMAGDRHEWTLELPRHVLDEARLAAASRPFEQHGNATRRAGAEDLQLRS